MAQIASFDNETAQKAINDFVTYEQNQLQAETAKAPVLVKGIIRFAIIMLATAIIISIVVLIVLIRSFKGSIAQGQAVAEALAQGSSDVKVQGGTDARGVLVTYLGM